MDPTWHNTGLDIPQREIISRSPAPYYDPTDKLFVVPRGGRTGRLLHLSLRRDSSLNVTKAERTHDGHPRLSSIPSSIHLVLLCCTRYDYCVLVIEILRIISRKILARGSLLIIGEDIVVTLEIHLWNTLLFDKQFNEYTFIGTFFGQVGRIRNGTCRNSGNIFITSDW